MEKCFWNFEKRTVNITHPGYNFVNFSSFKRVKKERKTKTLVLINQNVCSMFLIFYDENINESLKENVQQSFSLKLYYNYYVTKPYFSQDV